MTSNRTNSFMPRDPYPGQQKWTSLMHNGAIFPPPYEPHGVKILYNGEPVNLTHEQEEVFLCLLLIDSFITQVFIY